MARAIAAASAAEIAFIAGLTDREINRLVDEKVLRAPLVERDDGRRFAPLTAPFATFYFGASDNLTRAARVNVIETLTQRLLDRPDVESLLTLRSSTLHNFDWSVQFDAALTVVLTQYVEAACQRVGRVSRASRHITEDPDVLGGAPCFAGTRVSVANVLAAKQGMSIESLRAAWPFLTAQLLEDAEVYMKAHPRPGRPRKLDEAASNAIVVSRKAVRRVKRTA